METRKRKVDTALLLEEYRTLLETVDQLPLLISGNSMSPFLVHGRDTVFLTRVKRPLRRGDIVLYRRQNGASIVPTSWKWISVTGTPCAWLSASAISPYTAAMSPRTFSDTGSASITAPMSRTLL